jgi:coenzyme F420 hydrogenase subunit beta
LEKRIFNNNSSDPFLGKYLNLYIGRANDHFLLENSTSGGLVTALLCYCLRKKTIKGALITTMKKERPLEPHVLLALTEKDVVAASKSKYMPVPVNVGLEKIEATEGKYAIVGLPCHIHGARKAENINGTLDDRLCLHLGLFCSHTVSFSGTNMLIAKLGTSISKIADLSYRTGGWPGFFSIRLENGIMKKIAHGKVWAIFGSFFFVPPACFLCCDLTNELADISFGDAWLPELQGSEHGYSLIITRSKKGEELLQYAHREGNITLKRIDRTDILRSHKLGLLFKKRTYFARCAMLDGGKRNRVHNTILPESSFPYFFLAFLALLNSRVSNHRIFSFMIKNLPFKFFQIYDAIFTRCRILCSIADKDMLGTCK